MRMTDEKTYTEKEVGEIIAANQYEDRLKTAMELAIRDMQTAGEPTVMVQTLAAHYRARFAPLSVPVMDLTPEKDQEKEKEDHTKPRKIDKPTNPQK